MRPLLGRLAQHGQQQGGIVSRCLGELAQKGAGGPQRLAGQPPQQRQPLGVDLLPHIPLDGPWRSRRSRGRS
ncbi:hypothetical protein [Teichococcus aestuarii]|uniref:hypothetical protein n=1 Tax=Teichococcus aestuarii TaxID=568898 RepID=UPI00361D4A42